MCSRTFLGSLLLTLLLAMAAFGQLASFPKPAYFHETFARPVTKVELQPPVRLDDYVVGAKLELSLRSYLELVMANNTDIAIQRLTVDVAQNAITRAFAPFDPLVPPASAVRSSGHLPAINSPAPVRWCSSRSPPISHTPRPCRLA